MKKIRLTVLIWLLLSHLFFVSNVALCKDRPSKHRGYFSAFLSDFTSTPFLYDIFVSPLPMDFDSQSDVMGKGLQFPSDFLELSGTPSVFLNPYLSDAILGGFPAPDLEPDRYSLQWTELGQNADLECGTWIMSAPFAAGNHKYVFEYGGYYLVGDATPDEIVAGIGGSATYSGDVRGAYYGGYDMKGTFSCNIDFYSVANQISNFNLFASGAGYTLSITGAQGSFTGNTGNFVISGGEWHISHGSDVYTPDYRTCRGSLYGEDAQTIGVVVGMKSGPQDGVAALAWGTMGMHVFCGGDLDFDGDVDGIDLFQSIALFPEISVEEFAGNFGQADCPIPPQCIDDDGDGYGSGPDCLGPDCNDEDAGIYPGAQEYCDGADNDCNGLTDEEDSQGCTDYFRDEDDDGYGNSLDSRCLCAPLPQYAVTQGGDCDDNDPAINPGATEDCEDMIDNNCDGAADQYDEECSICNYDVFEPNEICAQAAHLGVVREDDSEIFLQSRIYPRGDKDYLKFYAEEGSHTCVPGFSQHYTVRIRMRPPAWGECKDYDLYLYDAFCSQIAMSVNSSCSEEEIVYSWDGVCGDNDSRYFTLLVVGWGASFDCTQYSLTIQMW